MRESILEAQRKYIPEIADDKNLSIDVLDQVDGPFVSLSFSVIDENIEPYDFKRFKGIQSRGDYPLSPHLEQLASWFNTTQKASGVITIENSGGMPFRTMDLDQLTAKTIKINAYNFEKRFRTNRHPLGFVDAEGFSCQLRRKFSAAELPKELYEDRGELMDRKKKIDSAKELYGAIQYELASPGRLAEGYEKIENTLRSIVSVLREARISTYDEDFDDYEKRFAEYFGFEKANIRWR